MRLHGKLQKVGFMKRLMTLAKSSGQQALLGEAQRYVNCFEMSSSIVWRHLRSSHFAHARAILHQVICDSLNLRFHYQLGLLEMRIQNISFNFGVDHC